MTTLERAKKTLAALEEDLAVQIKIYDHANNKMKRIKTEIELIKSKFGLFTEIDEQHKEKYKEHYEKEKVN
jgi:hypothetical protein